MKSIFGRTYDGPSHFNRAWAEENLGFRRQEAFDWLSDERLKERHLFEEQLWLPGIIESASYGPSLDEGGFFGVIAAPGIASSNV